MRRTYRYRLYPSAAQERVMEGWLEKLRWLYNRALAERRNAWRYRGALSAYKQKANLPALKARRPEFAQVHSQVLQDAVLRLDEAFENFFRRVKNGARKPGYPRFKGEGRYRSFRYPQASAFKVLDSFASKKMRLGGIGNVQLKYHRPMEGTPETATVVRYPSGKWYVCVTCELPEAPLPTVDAEKMTGYDLGLTSYAVSSDGEVVEPPRSLGRSEKKLRREQRRLSRTKKDSKRREKQRVRVARVHEKVKERRHDFLHKTSRKLVEENEGLAFERLQVANMMGNRRLAKAIADAGWRTFLTMTAYKALSAGKPFVLVEPGGTTQECSRCGTHVAKSLADRVHECPVCSLVLDRDHNAALNVRSRAGTVLTNARGEITPADELEHPQVASSKREAPSFWAG